MQNAITTFAYKSNYQGRQSVASSFEYWKRMENVNETFTKHFQLIPHKREHFHSQR